MMRSCFRKGMWLPFSRLYRPSCGRFSITKIVLLLWYSDGFAGYCREYDRPLIHNPLESMIPAIDQYAV